MWVDKTRVYAAKAIDNEYAYGRLYAGQQLYCNFLPTGSREEPYFIYFFFLSIKHHSKNSDER